jgi:hypothetical protein
MLPSEWHLIGAGVRAREPAIMQVCCAVAPGMQQSLG